MAGQSPWSSAGGADTSVGDGDALGGVAVENLRHRILAAVRRTCPRQLVAQMDDIVQTVLARLLLSARGGEGNRTFSSMYLTKAAYGAIVDELRRLSRRREDSLDGATSADSMAAREAGPERAAASAEIARGIQDCLARLLPPRRLAVTLYLQGCTVPEAADLLCWPAKKTENLVYRGLANLRACLTTKGLRP